ncbi:MAG: VOC family protein [Nanoarchaeota archaeon]|nr:VOC family protein [Nanoarchaeota archaeon]
MAQLNPSVRFNDGKCREAMNFYKECFGGELTLMTIGESPMAKDMPSEKQNFIMHSELKKGDLTFYGSDMMRDVAVVGDNMGMMLNCESEEELKTLFDKLSEGGEVFMPVEEAFWGALFGVTIDKYGVEWMLNFPKKTER